MNTYAQTVFVAVITFILSACLAYENPSACRFGGFRRATRAPACPPRGNFPGLPHPAASQTGCTCLAAAEIGCIDQNYFDEGGGGKLSSTGSPGWELLGFCSALPSHHFVLVGRLRWLWGSVSLLAHPAAASGCLGISAIFQRNASQCHLQQHYSSKD